MNMVDSVPVITPNSIAKMNERIESAPRMKMQSSTSSVEAEVMIVRPRVLLSDLFTSVKKSCLGYRPMFSRTRSNTTTVSLI